MQRHRRSVAPLLLVLAAKFQAALPAPLHPPSSGIVPSSDPLAFLHGLYIGLGSTRKQGWPAAKPRKSASSQNRAEHGIVKSTVPYGPAKGVYMSSLNFRAAVDGVPPQARHVMHDGSWPIHTAVPRPVGKLPYSTTRIRSRGGSLTQLGVVSTDRKAELILAEVENVDGVDVNIKLENLGGRRRRISGGLAIEAPTRAIWDVLTDYDSLNEYIPNIAASGAVRQPNGRVRIEQVGVISPTLRITTRIVLEVVEEPYRKLTFSKVESREFLEFKGTYSITQISGAGTSYLEYSVEALPLPVLPIQLVQGKIKQEVPRMLAAVRTISNKNNDLRRQTQGPYWMEDLPAGQHSC